MRMTKSANFTMFSGFKAERIMWHIELAAGVYWRKFGREVIRKIQELFQGRGKTFYTPA